MANSRFSLSSDNHIENISNGLSSLQQNGEFVDMTLAADGHLVKVHQVVLALSSSFFKDLIVSAQCSHPVIVLNKISHTTLSAMLEYIYTGEVLVAVEDLSELIDAAKDLHIKGLKEMNLSQALTVNRPKVYDTQTPEIDCLEHEEDLCYMEINRDEFEKDSSNLLVSDVRSVSEEDLFEIPVRNEKSNVTPEMLTNIQKETFVENKNKEGLKMSTLQYTVSNQGSLQIILNRFVYYLKHTNRDRSRQWRCVDYLNNYKCPAHVITRDDVVVQRISAHNHPFHDKKILKKVKSNAVFTAIRDAEIEGKNKKSKSDDQNESE